MFIQIPATNNNPGAFNPEQMEFCFLDSVNNILRITLVTGTVLTVGGSAAATVFAAILAWQDSSGGTPTPTPPTIPVDPVLANPSGFALTATTLAAIPVGVNSDLGGLRLLPDSHPAFWTGLGEDPNSASLIAAAGIATQRLQWDTTMCINYFNSTMTPPIPPLSFSGPAPESDAVAMMPNPATEGGSDNHALCVDVATGFLTEAENYAAVPATATTVAGYSCYSVAAFDLLNYNGLRPDEFTSADAAGLPIAPFVCKWKDVTRCANAVGGPISLSYPLRFTLPQTMMARLFRHPGTHFASTTTTGLSFGMRFVLNPSYDVTPYTIYFQTILLTLKKFGMFIADNGQAGFVQLDNDANWNRIYNQNGTVATTYAGGGTGPTAFALGGVYINDEFHATLLGSFYIANPVDAAGDIGDSTASQAPSPTITRNADGTYSINGANGAFIENANPVRLTNHMASEITLAAGQTLFAYSEGENSLTSVTAA